MNLKTLSSHKNGTKIPIEKYPKYLNLPQPTPPGGGRLAVFGGHVSGPNLTYLGVIAVVVVVAGIVVRRAVLFLLFTLHACTHVRVEGLAAAVIVRRL